MISIDDDMRIRVAERAVRRGRLATWDQIADARRVLAAEHSDRLARLEQGLAEVLRGKLASGGRPPVALIEWLRGIDAGAVAAWESGRKAASHAKAGADRVAEHVARRSDLGELPPWDDAAAVARIKADPVWACWHYFPAWFYRPPSTLTRQAVERIWAVILCGGNQSIGFIRGGGKSTITKALLILAGLCGMLKYAVAFGSSSKASRQLMRDIIMQLETNPILLADFPAACIPLRQLGGRSQRCAGQTYHGERTYIRYEGDVVKLATIPGAASSGFLLRCAGIESGFLGLVDNGVRPDFVLGDDIQSLEAAKSDDSVASLENAVRQGFEGLGGKDNPLRIVLLATCTREGDFSDRLLDPEIYPEYSGFRLGLVNHWGKGGALWEQYCEIWRQCQRDGDKAFHAATAFYAANREKMDEGVEVTDPEFFVHGLELSAIQSAWNMRIRMGDAGYFAQIEQRPMSPRTTIYELTPKQVAGMTNRLPRRRVPSWATGVFGFSDVGMDKLRWAVVAFGPRMRAAVLDYGAWPERGNVVPKDAPEQVAVDCIWRAQAEVAKIWESAVWMRGDLPMRLWAGGFDRGFKPDSIMQFCASRSTQYRFPLVAMRGQGWKQFRPSSPRVIRAGWNVQMVRNADGGAVGEYINTKVDFWKEVVQRAFLAPDPDAPGACSLFGTDSRSHAEFADQICGEILTDKAVGQGGTEMWNFSMRPGSQNHYLDAVVGCYALAAFFGVLRADDDLSTSGGVAPMDAAAVARAAKDNGQQRQQRKPTRQARVAIEE